MSSNEGISQSDSDSTKRFSTLFCSGFPCDYHGVLVPVLNIIPINKLKEARRLFCLTIHKLLESNVEYYSEEESHPVSKTLDPEKKVTLLVHNGHQSTRASSVEQILIGSIIDRLPKSYTEDSEDGDVGVVVPFREQSSELDSMMPECVQVNTVEKFQGDEKDRIMGWIEPLLEIDSGKLQLIIGAAESVFRPEKRIEKSLERSKMIDFIKSVMLERIKEKASGEDRNRIEDLESQINTMYCEVLEKNIGT